MPDIEPQDKKFYTKGKNSLWQTPYEVIAPIREYFGRIDLDPCAAANTDIGYENYTGTDDDDGLSRPWGGLTYCNPPYGREMHHWVNKCVEEYRKGTEIIALVPASTESQWFQGIWETADQICFWKGRIRFIDPETELPASDYATFSSAVVYWGSRERRFKKAFSTCGTVLSIP